MTTMRWILVGVGVAAAVGFGLWWRDRDNRLRYEGSLGALIEQQRVKDSAMMAGINRLATKLDSSLKGSGKATSTFTRVVEKVPVPGTIESVYVDTSFSNLPDSAKVELLRSLGLEVTNQCNALRRDCQAFRDSVMQALQEKDKTIKLWSDRFNNKPRRSCGPGGTVGGVAGFDPWQRKGFAGVGGSAGIACSF